MLYRVLLGAALTLLTFGGVPASLRAAPALQVDEEAIRQTVLRANSDEIYSEAYRSGNAELLRAAWGGEALLDMEEDIAGLRRFGQYLDLTLEDMAFQRIEELGPGRVRAVTVERWLARLYQTGGEYLGYQRQVVENRYLVEQRGDTWLLTEADQEIQGGDPVFRPGEPG
jgi:hypothetical protein